MVPTGKPPERERPKFWAPWFKWSIVIWTVINLLPIAIGYINWPNPAGLVEFTTITGSIEDLRSRSPHFIVRNERGGKFNVDFPVFYDFGKPPGAPVFFINDILMHQRLWQCPKLTFVVDELMLIPDVDYRLWGVTCLSRDVITRSEIEINWGKQKWRQISIQLGAWFFLVFIISIINYYGIRRKLRNYKHQ